MEVRKRTLLSALTGVAGVLVEVIFHDVLSNSGMGIAFSIILAVFILGAAYSVLDGFCSMLMLGREEDKKSQGEYEQRIYGVLNELLQFDRVIYKVVHTLQQTVEDTKEKDSMAALADTEEIVERLGGLIKKSTAETAGQFSAVVKEEAADALEKLGALVKTDTDGAVEQLETILHDGTERVVEKLCALEDADLSDKITEGLSALLSDYMDKAAERDKAQKVSSEGNLGETIERLGERMNDSIEESAEKSEASINKTTTATAKLIARHISHSTEELKELLEQRHSELSGLLQEIKGRN